MTYATFLLAFLLPPIALLGGWFLVGAVPVRRGLFSTAVLSLVALLYTTPWDNYLVANRLWWYAPVRVSSLVIGWVPLEEYLFFILQPIATGLWTLFVLRRTRLAGVQENPQQACRFAGAVFLTGIWAAALLALVVELQPWRYLALILIWAIPPLALQFVYGADQLWVLRRSALLAVLPPTLYLAAADALAIDAGVWTINPAYSLGLKLGGILPLEEFLFFLLTNCLIAFSLILIAARWRFAATAPRRTAH